MTELPYVIQTIRTVKYHDFDKFVKEVYGKGFSIVADQELSNDSEASFIASKEPLDEYDVTRLEEFSNRGRYNFLAHAIFTDLVNRDLIPEGKYLIEVCW